MTLLRRGQKFAMAGRQWRVAYVNSARAHCVSSTRVPVTLRDRAGHVRTFNAERRISIDISPNSAIDLFIDLERAS